MNIFSGLFNKGSILYIGILFSIIIPFSYFLIVIAQKIFSRVIMFRRINLQNTITEGGGSNSKQGRGKFLTIVSTMPIPFGC